MGNTRCMKYKIGDKVVMQSRDFFIDDLRSKNFSNNTINSVLNRVDPIIHKYHRVLTISGWSENYYFFKELGFDNIFHEKLIKCLYIEDPIKTRWEILDIEE
jgi:hypothetical protein